MQIEANSPTVVLVSGASRGLGLALVDRLLRARGVSVAAFARQETTATIELEREFGRRFLFMKLDARDLSAIESFVARAAIELGPPTGLVNNAALGQDHLLANMPVDLLGELLDVNLRAPILLTRQVVRRMMIGCAGSIVNVSSICASRGYPGLSVYSAAKGGLEAVTRSLARELGPRGIRVNAVAPGFFESEMSAALAPAQLDAIRRRTPLGRLIHASDVVPTIERLLLDEAGVTGQVVTIDAGASA